MKDKATELTKKMLELLRDHYMSAGAMKRENVFEALSAMATAVAVTLEGCADPEAVDYFNETVERAREEFRESADKIVEEGLN